LKIGKTWREAAQAEEEEEWRSDWGINPRRNSIATKTQKIRKEPGPKKEVGGEDHKRGQSMGLVILSTGRKRGRSTDGSL